MLTHIELFDVNDWASSCKTQMRNRCTRRHRRTTVVFPVTMQDCREYRNTHWHAIITNASGCPNDLTTQVGLCFFLCKLVVDRSSKHLPASVSQKRVAQ